MSVPSNLIPTRISQLPVATTPQLTDTTLIVQGGVTKRTSLGDMTAIVTVPPTRLIDTGTGLGGGGDLSANRTLYLLDTGVVASTYGSSTQVPILTVNAQGQITSATTSSFSVSFASITGKPTTLAGYGITDAQPLNDNLTALAGVGVAGFYVRTGATTAEARAITAGTGMVVTNGNGVSGNPVITLDDTAVTPGIFGSATESPVITIDQQGRITTSGNITITPDWLSITNTPTTLAGYGITDAVPNSRTVTGVNSISGGGNLSANRTFQLVNDQSAPGSAYYYGTDVGGSKGWFALSSIGGGTVTSVGLAMPSIFTVSGSPVTAAGTLTAALANQAINVVFAGPYSGSAAAPTFRSLGDDDLPIVSPSKGGTGAAATLTGYVYGNGSSAMTASTTIPNTAITGLGTMSVQNANSVAITGGTATFSSVTLTSGTISTTPSGGTDIVNKAYVDSVAEGLKIKASCEYGTTGNITLSGLGTQAGGDWASSLTAGDRILVKNQTAQADNGIYAASSSGWTRTSDANTWNELVSAFTFVHQGTTQADTGWVCTIDPGGTLGVTPVTWTQFSGAGTYTAGTGLTLTGTTFSITNTAVTANSYGSASTSTTFTVNAQGQLTAAGTTPIAITNTQVSGLGTMSTQNASSVAITGGTINGTSIGATTRSSGAFTTLDADGNVTLGDASADTVTINGTVQPGVVISGSSGGDAFRITQTGSGNALVVEDSANPDSTPVVIDSTGAVVVGYTSAISVGGLTPNFQINGVTSGQPEASITKWQANSTGPFLKLAKSRSATIGTFASTVSGDTLGSLSWYGDDGTSLVQSASILAAVDGTPGTNDMPGRLVFSTTADGASSPTERMRISSDGGVGIGGSTSTNVTLRISKSITGAASSYGIFTPSTIQSDVTTTAFGVATNLATAASSFTLAGIQHFAATQATIGAGSVVTNQYGFVAGSTLTGATNNFGFYSNIAAATGRWNFYANGTAENYFAGATTFNSSVTANSLSLTTALSVSNGGTGATTVAGAQTNLQVDPAGTAIAMAIALG